MKKSTKKTDPPDPSFARAAHVLLPRRDALRLCLVGCGGTGSWLAPAVARLARVVGEQGREVRVEFYDPDMVEAGNIPRQNFCDAEFGRHKAITLAQRFGAAWGLEIAAHPRRFEAKDAGAGYDIGGLVILIGCVDNARGRQELHRALGTNRRDGGANLWWLDCGNSEESGQVLLGSAKTVNDLHGCFQGPKIVTALPSPALVEPSLLVARAEEETGARLSCAELMIANEQSLAVNQMAAAFAADYLMRLLTGRPLKRFATYFDLVSGSSRSRAITPEELAAVTKKQAKFFLRPKGDRAAAKGARS